MHRAVLSPADVMATTASGGTQISTLPALRANGLVVTGLLAFMSVVL